MAPLSALIEPAAFICRILRVSFCGLEANKASILPFISVLILPMECKLRFRFADGQKDNREIKKQMIVAERSAFHSISNTFSTLHLLIPLGVMGILLAGVARFSALAMDLLIGLSVAISIIATLLSMYFLQSMWFSVFPSLLPSMINLRCLHITEIESNRSAHPLEDSCL